MSDEIRHEMTGLLAAQVDSFAEVIEQRDLARSVAVGLEGELHAVEIERDALIAQLHDAERRIEEAVRTLRWLPSQYTVADENALRVVSLLHQDASRIADGLSPRPDAA